METKNRFKDKFKIADSAFNGLYGKELNALMGLSQGEIDSIVPGTTDLRVYSVLIKIVEEASIRNINQAQLISDIKKLGEIGVEIAKKVPQFAALL